MVYVVIVLIVVVGGAILLGAQHVMRENSPGTRPSLIAARRVVRQSRGVGGELCVCGGTLQATDEVSERYGALLGCTGCRRAWTADGSKVVRRPRSRRPGSPRPGIRRPGIRRPAARSAAARSTATQSSATEPPSSPPAGTSPVGTYPDVVEPPS